MYRISSWAMAAIVALRLATGLHFYSEGMAKIRDPKPFSSGFFSNAKGPLAGFYRSLVWDPDGSARFDVDQTSAVWGQFVEKAKRHYGFDDKQTEYADKVLEKRVTQLKNYLGSISDEIDEYYKGLTYLRTGDRQDRPDDKRVRVGVASLKGQWDKTESELKAKRGPWLSNIDKLSKDLEREINAVASDSQSRRGAVAVGKPGRRFMDSEGVDAIIPYFDLAIGALLVIGLFTRPAAIAGGLFLASVVLSQWPGTPGAISTAYQSIEMFSLFVLAAVGAGQFAGLDYLIAHFRGKDIEPIPTTAKASAS